MRDIIKKQLDSLVYARLTNFNPETGTAFIPKYSEPCYEINKCYLVKVNGTLVNAPTSMQAVNWNHGTSPTTNILKIYVSKLLGKNVYVDSIAYDLENKKDLNVYWSGWLPMQDLTQMAVL